MYHLLQQYLGTKPLGYDFFASGKPYGERIGTIDTAIQYGSSSPVYESITHRQEERYTQKKEQKIYEPQRMMTMSFSHESFLVKNRPPTQFVGDAAEIKDSIEEAFQKTTGQPLPKDVVIRLCTKEELQRIHSQFGKWEEGIQGFSLNRKQLGNFSEIFVKKDFFDRTMLTIGHELGHVFTPALPNIQDEEAKAFAFELAWMEVIREHNIGGLRTCIRADFSPAENGIHDVAFAFVLQWLKKGLHMFALYGELVKRSISIKLDELVV